jgi:hypothetical protein
VALSQRWQLDEVHFVHVLPPRAYPKGQVAQLLVELQETSAVHLELAREYPPKQVRQRLLASQVAQGKGQTGLQTDPWS